jgi:hypothetical protein
MKLPAVSLLALSLTLALNTAVAGKPAATDIDPARLSQDVKVLSSDEFEGRGPATAGETKTIDYVVAQMKAAGLQPGGDLKDGKREWTQAVPLARAQIKGTPAISVAVKGKTQALTQGEQIAVRAAQDGSTAIDISKAPLVFAGYGVNAPERSSEPRRPAASHPSPAGRGGRTTEWERKLSPFPSR